MIRLQKGTQPQVLAANGTAWNNEYVIWRAYPVGSEPQRYRHPEIRSALEGETCSKCAYCEGRIDDVAYNHIEHKLPKAKHPALVCTWDNLTIACPRCNTKKSDYDDPDCPLLDPYVDNIEHEVLFAGPLALDRNAPRAHVTIEVLDLNRKGLFLSRSEILQRLNRLLNFVERAVNEPALLQALWIDIDKFTAAEGEFASTCRQFLTLQIAERGLTRP